MERTSTRPLAVQKTICRKQMRKDSGRVVMRQSQVTEQKHNPALQAQQSSSILNHAEVDHSDSEQYVENRESGTLMGLVSMLEKYDSELKFIAAYDSILESAQREGSAYDIEHMKAEDENRASPELFSTSIDSEMMLENICCDGHLLLPSTAPVIDDRVTTYCRELQHHETDTLSARCCPSRNLLGSGNEIAPLKGATPFEERMEEYVHTISMEEIQMNSNDNHSVQSFACGGDSSFDNERSFQYLQASSGAQSLAMEVSDAKQAEDENEIYGDQSDGEYPNKENWEVEYKDDVSTAEE